MKRMGRLFRGSTHLLRVAAASVLLGPLAGRSSAAQNQVAPLPYTRFVLPNGLVAILNENRATPIVSIQVRYHVGSKDDRPDRPGIAHLCEHLMSLGSPHLNQPQRAFYQSIGGTSTRYAETTEDVTEYFITVPSNELETVLWAESDRMAAPLALADSQRIAATSRVVEQERRQNIDNVPFGAYRELTSAALFPRGHPYRLTPLSQAAVSSAVRPDEVRATCLPYYIPNNAVLAISGDFATAQARALVEKYFGGIPRGASLAQHDVITPPLAGEQRLVLEDARATAPRLHFDWLGASYDAPDRMALVAAASVLSFPRFGRLSSLLVDDLRLAASVTAGNYDLEKSGVFEIVVVPRPGASMTRIEQLVDSTIASLQSAPPTDEEIARFNAANRVEAATSLQVGFARADTLAHDQAFTGNPTSYATQTNDALTLNRAAVRFAAKKYLSPARVVMSLVPAGRLDLISRPDRGYTNVTPRSPSPAERP